MMVTVGTPDLIAGAALVHTGFVHSQACHIGSCSTAHALLLLPSDVFFPNSS